MKAAEKEEEELMEQWEKRKLEMKILEECMDALLARMSQIERRLLMASFPEIEAKKILPSIPYPRKN